MEAILTSSTAAAAPLRNSRTLVLAALAVSVAGIVVLFTSFYFTTWVMSRNAARTSLPWMTYLPAQNAVQFHNPPTDLQICVETEEAVRCRRLEDWHRSAVLPSAPPITTPPFRTAALLAPVR